TEVTGVSGSEFIACYVDNSDLVTTIYKPKLNTENDKVEMRKHFIDRPVSTHSFILFSKEKDYIFEGKPSHKFEFICTDVAEEGELENYNSSSETEDFLTYIVKTLTQRRIAYRLTQQELADRVGLKQSAIARFEASAHTFTYPRLSTVELIATGLGMNLVLFKENEDEVGGKE
ncbi:helix-turn-helix transcriptional regulator, partial [Bacillus thuringiensis]|nr:helix-turn-helix transcriptional regulator [Bacillus thuringiensis]